MRTYSSDPSGENVLLKYIGESEIPGPENNYMIQHMIRHAFMAIGKEINENWVNDKLAYCAVTAIYAESAIGNDVKGLDFRAISFMEYGTTVDGIENAKYGDLIILYQFTTERWESHVGYLLGFIGDNVILLGGNQSNKIGISAYPIAKIRENGIRRPPNK